MNHVPILALEKLVIVEVRKVIREVAVAHGVAAWAHVIATRGAVLQRPNDGASSAGAEPSIFRGDCFGGASAGSIPTASSSSSAETCWNDTFCDRELRTQHSSAPRVAANPASPLSPFL